MTRGEDAVEELVDNWEYWCPNQECRNRTFSIELSSTSYYYGKDGKDDRYLKIRILKCSRCHSPLVMGTYTYRNSKDGWDARGQTITRADARMAAAAVMSGHGPTQYPVEYIAFLEPPEERQLPIGLNKKIVASFREAEYAVSKNKPISAAASIRNTVRLIVEDNKITDSNLKDAIKKLPFEKAYRDAIGDLKIVGDDSMHYEEYELNELRPALEVLALALNNHSKQAENMKLLRQAVGSKRSKKDKEKQDR